MLPKLLVATTNKGKVAEITALLAGLPYTVLSLNDLPTSLPAPAETGATFAENALLKADYYHAHSGWLTLADDSGLAVTALNGRPGVHSARYAGAGATTAQMIAKLLNEMVEVKEAARQASFICVMALCDTVIRQTFEGRCDGLITRAPRGEGGFGYDPVFLDPVLGRTFAEMTRAEKSAISHRGSALQKVRAFLER
jgi:XTP/dITP diphosphohydrolase